jgi:HAD superfamily hydrolase (TIGR01490 family)
MRQDSVGAGVAAFFDVDGTLIGEPSLERRFFADLRSRGAIPARNYLLWLARAARLMPRGMQMVRHANKMYLRGVCTDGGYCELQAGQPAQQGSAHADMAGSRLRFFPAAINRVAWHAKQRHAIVLVTGTLAPLAQEVALALVIRLAVRGIATSVGVCATRLEEKNERWTGRIIEDAMFGEAKARAMRRIAVKRGFDLGRCYAYGNCVTDRWMLEAVGRPAVVNPSQEMARLARRREWAVFTWAEKGTLGQAGDPMHAGHEAEKVA